MRLLHLRDDSGCNVSFERSEKSHGRANRCGDGGSHLPMRYLSAHRGRNQESFAHGAAGSEPMNHRLEPATDFVPSISPAGRGISELDRRDFLKVLGGGLLICLTHTSSWAQESGRGFGGHELPKELSAWLHIAADGQVKVFTGKVEVGQNIRTSLAQLVAEELKVPFEAITMVMGDTDLTPWDMGTFGSRTTPTMGPQLRTMAAAARQMLLEIAAQRWHVATAG